MWTVSPCRRRRALGAALLLSVLWTTCPSAALAHAGHGVLTGVVTDSGTGERLESAVVEVPASGHVTVTDLWGVFRLESLSEGTHEVVARRVGFQPSTRAVRIVPGQEQQVRFELSPRPIRLEQVLVAADRAATSAAASAAARGFDLRTRPAATASDLLETTPGLLVARHAGGALADQIFLRGFDAGFGGDVAIAVDGMPVNLVSHGHGQGYADLRFLIPELVGRVEVAKGPYSAAHGNLATAGHINFLTRNHLHESLLRVGGGAFGTAQYTILYQLPSQEGQHSAYLAGDYYRTDGPYDHPQNLERLTLFSRVRRQLAPGVSLTATAGGYASAWNASGLIPVRAVKQGRVSRWGAIDDTQGGSASRLNASLTLRAEAADAADEVTARVYASRSDLDLYENLTYHLQDPIFGDQVEQGDHRVIAGLETASSHDHRLGPAAATARAGVGLRADDARVSLWQTVRRRRYWPILDVDITERNLFLWGEEDLTLAPGLRLVLGVRQDYFSFRVADDLETSSGYVLPLSEWLKNVRASGKAAHVPLVQPHASGTARQSITSPKASLAWAARESLDLFANFGLGFHSNDARAVIVSRFLEEQVRGLQALGAGEAEIATILDTLNFDVSLRGIETLPRAVGAEVGLRLRLDRGGPSLPPYHRLGPTVSHYPMGSYFPVPDLRLTDRLNLAAALWWLDVEEELIYAPDVGVVEARGATRRWGVDLEVRAQVLPWLWLDGDGNWARPRRRDAPEAADAVPMAPRFTSAGGLTLRPGGRFQASLRYRHLGARPAVADESVTTEGYTVLGLGAAYGWQAWRLELTVQNLLDATWQETQYALDSLLPGEGALVIHGPGPPREIHFSPGPPRHALAALSYAFR